jgi:hypothetical protein
MRQSLRLRTGLALAAALTFAATLIQAQVTTTVVLKSGEKHTGTNLGYRLDEREVAVRTSQSQEPRVPVGQVAYIDFGGTADPSNLNLSGSQEAVVLRDSSVIKGQILELGHVNRGDQTTPYLVIIRNEGGEERRINANQVARVYFAGGASSTTTGSTGSTGSTGTTDSRGLTVSAQQQWTATGLTVRRGEPITVSASGDIRIGGDNNPSAGPGGASQTHPSNPLPSAPSGALIGRVNNGQPFLIGSQSRVTVPEAGQLFLGVNDSYLSDNQGNFQVEVRRIGRIR